MRLQGKKEEYEREGKSVEIREVSPGDYEVVVKG